MKRTRWPLFAALLALALGALLATQIAWAQTDSVTVSVSDASVTEGDSGRVLMKFAVALSGSPSHDVTVHVATMGGTATIGTWEDAYLYHSSRKIVFAANAAGAELSRIVPVHVYGDTAAEDDETFTLQLTRIETSDHRVMFEGGKRRLEATGTIIDDDEDEQAVPQAPAPEAPTFRTVTGGANQATLTWTKPPGPITKYQYRAKRGSGAWNISSHPWTDIPNSAALETYTVTELKAGQWSFRLRAVNEAGDGEQAKPLGAVKVTELVPTNLAARPESSPEMALAGPTPMYVDLTWTAPEGSVTGYEYQYRAAPDGEWGAWTPIPNSAALTSYRIFGLDAGSYEFKLRAVNAAGAGPESASVSATLLPRRPTAPANLTAAAGPGQVQLSWDASIGRSITGYQVGYARNGEPRITWTSVGNTRTHTLRSLDAGVRYEFFVRAVNTAVNGAQASVEAVLAATAPSVTAVAGPNRVRLNWTAPAGVITEYQLRYKQASDAEWGGWKSVGTATTHTLESLAAKTEYQLIVRAQSIGGDGAESTVVSATPTKPVTLEACTLQIYTTRMCGRTIGIPGGTLVVQIASGKRSILSEGEPPWLIFRHRDGSWSVNIFSTASFDNNEETLGAVTLTITHTADDGTETEHTLVVTVIEYKWTTRRTR